MPLKDSLFTEVYFVAPDHVVSDTGTLKVFSTLEDLHKFLASKNVTTSSDLRVIHGFLTPATVIPKSLGENVAVYIVLEDPYELGKGVMLDADNTDDYEELAEEVESAVQGDETSSFVAEMESTYLLFGYEVNVVMWIDEGDLDAKRLIKAANVANVSRLLYSGRTNGNESDNGGK